MTTPGRHIENEEFNCIGNLFISAYDNKTFGSFELHRFDFNETISVCVEIISKKWNISSFKRLKRKLKIQQSIYRFSSDIKLMRNKEEKTAQN